MAVTYVNETQIELPAGVPPLSSLYVYAAGSCNLACRHCWIVPKFQPDGIGGSYIKLEYIAKAIREGKSLGLSSIKLTGGEPLLHPQFRQLIAMIDEAGLKIVIETNGTLVDKSMAQFLQTTPSFNFISVSLDGSTPETHDGLRSVQGSYAQAVCGIQNLVEVGVRPQMICTLHKGNVSEMVDVVMLAEQLGCGSIKFNHVQKVGRGEKFGDDQGLTISELIELYRYIESEIVPNISIPIYFDIPMAFLSLNKLLRSPLGRCGVKSILGLLSGGEYALCGIGVTVPDLLYGHVRKDNLRDVWCAGLGLVRLREQIPAQLKGICGQCIHNEMCQGECVANNYHLSGKLNAAHSFCEHADVLGLFPPSRKKQILSSLEKGE